MTAAEARLLTPCLTFQLAEQARWDLLKAILYGVRCESIRALVAIAENRTEER